MHLLQRKFRWIIRKMFYFLSVLCTLCRNVMFCKFQESSRHSFETGGIVTSVWRCCCCLRDPLQSILNNSFRLHFSLKLQFCVSLFVSSPKEEPEKTRKGSKDDSSSRVWPRSRRKFWQCRKIKSGHGFHIHLRKGAGLRSNKFNCSVAIKYLYCLQLVAKQRKQAVIKETVTCQYPMCVKLKNALLFNKWWNKTWQSSTLVSGCQTHDRDKCWHLHKPETNFWFSWYFKHFQNGCLYSIGQAMTM